MTKPDPISPCPMPGCGGECEQVRSFIHNHGLMASCPSCGYVTPLAAHEKVCEAMKNDKIIVQAASTVEMPVEVLMDFIKRMDWRSYPEDKSWYLVFPRYAIRAGGGSDETKK